jgi:hypothetical protein
VVAAFASVILSIQISFGLGAVLLLFLVSELQKKSYLVSKPGNIFFLGFGLLSCDLAFERTSYVFSAFLQLCLVSELQYPPSP